MDKLKHDRGRATGAGDSGQVSLFEETKRMPKTPRQTKGRSADAQLICLSVCVSPCLSASRSLSLSLL